MKMKSLLAAPYRRILQLRRFLLVLKKVFLQRGVDTIWVFGAPSHSNLGDQAQTYCITKWAKENYPSHDVFVFQQFATRLDYGVLGILRKMIGPQDLLFCHSGYHMTELYPLHKIYQAVLRMFPDYPVVVFPQTINFKSEGEARAVAKTFDEHPNCTLLCRDEISYESAKKLFKNTKLLLYPDIVTSLIGTKTYPFDRTGVLFCMRNDQEGFYTPEEIDGLRKRFGEETALSDTTVSIPAKFVSENREAVLESTFEKYAHYKLIITDRYHGTIFSLIAGTPVVVLSSTDHKLSSGVKWFPSEIFENYISFAKDLDHAFEVGRRLLENPPTQAIPAYFKTAYYNELKKKLEGKR